MILKLGTQNLPVYKDRLAQIWLDGNLDAHSFISPRYFKDNIDYVKEAFDSALIYVVTDDQSNDIAGFAGLTDNYIAGFFIKRSWRNHGYGAKLLSYLKLEHKSLYLDVYKKNDKALNFYLKHGFVIDRLSVDMATAYVQYTLHYSKE